jgi:prepilin-type processing-associated H-X9-DG protein
MIRDLPLPTSVSEQARRYLANPLRNDDPLPALHDVDGWVERAERGDRYLVERFGGLQLPVSVDEIEVAGVHVYVVRAQDVAERSETPIFLDIHGGGLTGGKGDACRLMASAGALSTGLIHWAVDYRMPPRHPYPTPLDDCLAVYRELLGERPPEDIFVGGVSAGGNLAAALLCKAKAEGLPMPKALVLLTPEVDLTESGDSFQTNRGVDSVLGSLMQANLLYADGHDLTDPFISPLFADVAGFPPTFLQSGTRDLYLSNTVRMHRKLRAAGIEAELHVFEAMPHGGFGGAPEDLEMRAELRKFLDRKRRDLH